MVIFISSSLYRLYQGEIIQMITGSQLILLTDESEQSSPAHQALRRENTENTAEAGNKVDQEELRFIYKLISDGYSDLDILKEYASLHDNGDTRFPLRASEDFIRDRRREMEVAVQILKDGIKTMLNPLIMKQKEEHQKQLSEISAMLLGNGLHTVEESSSAGIYGLRKNGMFRYRYTIKDHNNKTIQLSRYQLFNMFRKNVENACQRYTQFVFYECYIPHLKNEIVEIEEEGFWPQVERQPFEVIGAIRELSKLETFKGICPLCNEFESKIPPFVGPLLFEDTPRDD